MSKAGIAEAVMPQERGSVNQTGTHLPKILWLFRCLAAGLGLAQIVACRNTIGPDARSYLELARAILRHDWAMTINAYWSALYPWLLATVLGIIKPKLRWEFPVAHALAFPVLLACIAAFEFFWKSLLRATTISASSLPSVQLWTLGYSLFIWMTVGDLITAINPDLCMTTMILLTAGLLVRIVSSAEGGLSVYAWFGVCLGVGFLVKAILFPMGFVFLAAAFLALRRHSRREMSRLLLAAVIFFTIAAPEVALLSHAKGRLTFSDTGKLAYAWYTYNLPLRDWQGGPPGSGVPLHPTRKIYDRPSVFEFNGPLRSSYPPWFDPSYWNDGLSPKFNLQIVARHSFQEAMAACRSLIEPTAWAVGMLLLLVCSDVRKTFAQLRACWYLIAIALTAFPLYSLTLVQSRYLAPWVLLLWGAVLAAIVLRNGTTRFTGGITILIAVALTGAMAKLVYGESVHGFHNDARAEYEIAEGLQKMGLQPGEKVGAIGFDNDAYWAYLSRINIVAEINARDACSFWSEPPARQAEILQKFAQAGASAVIANTGYGIRSTSAPIPVPLSVCSHPGPEWQAIDRTLDHIYFLK